MSHPAYWGTRKELRRPLFIYDTDAELIEASEYRICADTTLPLGKILIWNEADTTVFDAMDVIATRILCLPSFNTSSSALLFSGTKKPAP